MRHEPLTGLRRLSWLVALSVLLGTVLAAEYVYRLEARSAYARADAAALQQASTLRARIEGELNSNLFITAGLVGYVTAHDLLESARVERALAVLHRNARHIRNVAMAPDNVVTYIYPVEGNEALIGMNYRDLPEQWPEVERAMQERATVLAGPLDLVQGGRGLISRTPVFLEDGEYWGLLSVVLDSDSLFRAVGLSEAEGPVAYAIRWQQGGPGLHARVAGDQSVFANASTMLDILVPGGVWQLAAVHDYRLNGSHDRLLRVRLGGYSLAALVSVLLFLLLEERRRVARLALLDQLTGLPNRRWFTRRARRMIKRAAQRAQSLALVYVDLDGFKSVNDRLGHRIGDEVLEELGRRMSASLAEDCFVSRIGGDEFVVLVRGVTTIEAALARIEPMLQAIRAPIGAQREWIELDASVGVALYPEDGEDLVPLMNAADRNMYASKPMRRRPLTGNR